MKQRYIPLEKRSKREQREYHASRRGNWGAVNPVTRTTPNPKAYYRKKSGQRYEHEPIARIFICLIETALGQISVCCRIMPCRISIDHLMMQLLPHLRVDCCIDNSILAGNIQSLYQFYTLTRNSSLFTILTAETFIESPKVI